MKTLPVKDALLAVLGFILTILFFISFIPTKVNGSAVYAREIIGPGGVRCFAIMSDDKVTGGNCIKD